MAEEEDREEKLERIRRATKDWNCIYPIYIDKRRSLTGGRRVGRQYAVVDPKMGEISRILTHLGIEFVREKNKTHPHDQLNPGRFRVKLDSSRLECRVELPITKRRLLYAICEKFSLLATRKKTAKKTPRSGGKT